MSRQLGAKVESKQGGGDTHRQTVTRTHRDRHTDTHRHTQTHTHARTNRILRDARVFVPPEQKVLVVKDTAARQLRVWNWRQ